MDADTFHRLLDALEKRVLDRIECTEREVRLIGVQREREVALAREEMATRLVTAERVAEEQHKGINARIDINASRLTALEALSHMGQGRTDQREDTTGWLKLAAAAGLSAALTWLLGRGH